MLFLTLVFCFTALPFAELVAELTNSLPMGEATFLGTVRLVFDDFWPGIMTLWLRFGC